MGLFNKSSNTTADTGSSSGTTTTTPTTSTKTAETTTSTTESQSGGSFLDVISGILGGGTSSGSSRANTGSGDPVTSIVSSISNVASAWINGDAKKEVAKLQIEANKLTAEAEASKADQALYAALKAKADTKTNEATQLANRVKSENITNWLIVGSIFLLAFGILYLVFKAVFGWTRSTTKQGIPNTSNQPVNQPM